MHITIIANCFQEDYIENLVNHLAHKVDRLDLIGSTRYEVRNFNDKVKHFNFRGDDHLRRGALKKVLQTLKYYYKLLYYLNKTDAQVVHVQWIRFHILDGVLLPLYIKLLGKKIIYTIHDLLPRMKDNWINRLKFRLIYNIPDMLIVHTNYIQSRVKNEFGIQESKVSVIVHGVYKRTKNANITKRMARDYFGLSHSTTVLLFFGFIVKYKGFDLLLKSLDTLRDCHEYQILVAGQIHSDYKREFTDLIDNYDKVSMVNVHRFIEDDEVEYCFKAADATVLPYREAYQSGVLFMSYAYGKPVIAPDLGGFPDDIIPHTTGYLYEPENAESLSHSLSEFEMEWRDATQDKYETIENFANSNYSWDMSCEKLFSLYKSTLEVS